MAMGPKNVFNNKADFKVLLPLDRFRMTVGPDIPPRVSAARNEPNWEKRQMATKGHRSGQDAAPATDLPWLSRYPRGVDWRMPLRVAPLYALLDDTAARHGRLVCTNFLGKTLTYSEIAHLVDRTAAGLQRLGVKKGTKVGLFLPNSPTFIVYFFAVLKAGGTIVNYNPLYTVSELAAQVKDSDTEIMVTLDLKVLFDKVDALLQSNVLARAIVCSFAPLLPPVKATLFRLFKSKNLARPLTSPARDRIVLDADVVSGSEKPAPIRIDPLRDVAVLQYTGGTTGTPKGAMLTHANVYVNVHQVGAWKTDLNEGEERVLGVLPFFHVFALTVVMNLGVAKGAEIIIMPRFSLDDALDLIAKTRPTVLPGVPTLFNALMNHPPPAPGAGALAGIPPRARPAPPAAPPRPAPAAARSPRRLRPAARRCARAAPAGRVAPGSVQERHCAAERRFAAHESPREAADRHPLIEHLVDLPRPGSRCG